MANKSYLNMQVEEFSIQKNLALAEKLGSFISPNKENNIFRNSEEEAFVLSTAKPTITKKSALKIQLNKTQVAFFFPQVPRPDY